MGVGASHGSSGIGNAALPPNHFGMGGSDGPRFGVTLGEMLTVELDADVIADGGKASPGIAFGEGLATVEGVENDRSAGFIGGVFDEIGTGSFSDGNKLDCTDIRPLPMTPCEGGT
jgi:hypothetical protein